MNSVHVVLNVVVLGSVLRPVLGEVEMAPARERIVVAAAGHVPPFAAAFERKWRRLPTAVELDGLIQGWIDTEPPAREARTPGLDRDEAVTRPRPRRKMERIARDLDRRASAA